MPYTVGEGRGDGYQPSLVLVVEDTGLVRAMQPERAEHLHAELPGVISKAIASPPPGCQRGLPSRVVVDDLALLQRLRPLLPDVPLRQGATPLLDQAFAILCESLAAEDCDGASSRRSVARTGNKNGDLQSRVGALLQLLDACCSTHLNDDYRKLLHKAVKALARQQPSPLLKGYPASWAAGLVHAIGSANFLFVPTQVPHCTIKAIQTFFDVSPSVVHAHSKKVRELLKVVPLAKAWTEGGGHVLLKADRP